MFNNNQNIEQEPGTTGAEQELNATQQERAAQWAESFPQEPNPWVQQAKTEETITDDDQAALEAASAALADTTSLAPDMDKVDQLANTPDEAPLEENPVQMSADTTNQIRNSTNPVTAALETSWNNGNGGPSLEDSYDSLQGKISSDDVAQLADKAAPTISHISKKNQGDAAVSENTQLEAAFGDSSSVADAQIENDLHDTSVSAGTLAFDAMATAESAIKEAEKSNDTAAIKDAEQEIQAAQSQIETLTAETEAAFKAVEGDKQLVDTARSMTSQAEEMTEQAQEKLQEAADAAEERQDQIAEHQEAVDQLVDAGAITTEEINQDLMDGGSVEQSIQQAAAENADALASSPNIAQENFDPLNQDSQKLNPELTTPAEEEEDREGPLISIFG